MTEISEGISLLKILKGFLFRLPELSGAWDFTVTYEQTSHPPFQGLQVTWQDPLLRVEIPILSVN